MEQHFGGPGEIGAVPDDEAPEAPGALDDFEPVDEREELEELGQLDHTSGLEDPSRPDDDATVVSGDDPGLQRDIDALGAVEAELADVELALRRLDDGSYGRCEVCDAAIDDARLADAPAARFCRAHLPITLG